MRTKATSPDKYEFYFGNDNYITQEKRDKTLN